MHYTYMKPKSSYAFGFGFGTVLPVNFSSLSLWIASGFKISKRLAPLSSVYISCKTKGENLKKQVLIKDWSGIEQGWIYGEWETGPWWGFRTKDKEAGKYGLVGSIFRDHFWLHMTYDFVVRRNVTDLKTFELCNFEICRWVGLGEGMRSDHMVWRHTCSIIDFKAILNEY